MELISVEDLNNLLTDRLEDAQVLLKAGRYVGAFYFFGYVLEIGLKKKICEALGWEKYPPSNHNELGKSFKTHDIEVLLMILGKDTLIKKSFFSEWSVVTNWKSEIRYSSRICTEQDVNTMMNAVDIILKNI